jgi:Hint domain
MATLSFLARGDSNTANNNSLNPIVTGGGNGIPTFTMTFTDDDPNSANTGDLLFDQPGTGPSHTTVTPDPDTWVIINGQTYQFEVLLTGTLPTSGPSVPSTLYGREVMVVSVDLPTGRQEFFFVLGEPPATQAEMDAITNGAIPISLQNDNPCFCAGTEIATPSGMRRVETLRPGDSVLTEDGRVAQLAWVGISSIPASRLLLDPSTRPVRIPAHAFGPGMPSRDLDVSPQHRVVVEGPACELLFGMPRAFVVAKHLLGTLAHTPKSDDGPDEGIEYVHLLLDRHEILVSNGLSSESFQPARRMLELMSGENLDRLMAALEVLGADAMLARPDALTTLSSREARVLLSSLKPAVAPILVKTAKAAHYAT